jgi:site-specific recombinase XerD
LALCSGAKIAVATTQIYTHVDQDRMAAVVNKL